MRLISELLVLLFDGYKLLAKENSQVLLGVAFAKIRKLALLFCTAFTLNMIFVGSIFLTLIEAAKAYDGYVLQGILYPSTLLILCGATVLLSVLGLAMVFISSRSVNVKEKKSVNEERRTSPLEQAVTVFLTDLVRERQEKRAHTMTAKDTVHPIRRAQDAGLVANG